MLTIENISDGLAGKFFNIKDTVYMVSGLVANEETYLIQLESLITTQGPYKIEVFLDRRPVFVTESTKRYKIERINGAWKFLPTTISIETLRNKTEFIKILENYLNKC
jgi:hypothetical protein